MRSLLVRLDALLDRYIVMRPKLDIKPERVDAHNQGKLEMLQMVVGMDDWIWDRCGIDRGVFRYDRRLCTDPDNPLYYFQSEMLIDEINPGSSGDRYYPSETSAELNELRKNTGIRFHMEELDASNYLFWLEWVKQEIRANTDTNMVKNGLSSLPNGTKHHWEKNSDDANVFLQNLLWFRRHLEKGRHTAGTERFCIAYITLFGIRTIQSVVMAVGVFVQTGALYTMMGMVKSFRVDMSNTFEAAGWMKERGSDFDTTVKWIGAYNRFNMTMKRAVVEFRQFIAREIIKNDPECKGLLFRPNGATRDILRESGVSMLVGSNRDWAHVRQANALQPDTPTNAQIMDHVPLIRQSDIELEISGLPTMPLPFWERRNRFSHPDSPLNPHLPLVFIGIDHLITSGLQIGQ